MKLNKEILSLSVAALCLPLVAQAALLTNIDGGGGAADYDGADFSGQTVTATAHNWGYNDTFVGANFSSATFSFNGGNQPFLFVDVTGADFSGATFNWTPFQTSGVFINIFRTSLGISGASFEDTVWNIVLNGSAIATDQMFDTGAGATSAATAADALSMAGADFNFSGSDTSLADDIGSLLIANLGGFDGGTAIGAFYDDDFVANNYASFGYGSEALLETALDSAGWQAIPEPSAYALLAGFTGLALAMIRRRR